MMMGRLQTIKGLFCALTVFSGAPAIAQNALPGGVDNTRNAVVYDGVTLAQLQGIFSQATLNGQPMSVVPRATTSGAPFLVVTAPGAGGFEFFISGIGGGYGGDDGGLFAGAALFAVVDTSGIAQSDINQFNYTNKMKKLIALQSGAILSVEFLIAGGLSEDAIMNSLLNLLDGLDAFHALGSSQTVNFEAGENPRTYNAGDFQIAAHPSVNAKLASPRDYDLINDRLVHQYVEEISR